MANFTKTNSVATDVETTVAFFCADIGVVFTRISSKAKVL